MDTHGKQWAAVNTQFCLINVPAHNKCLCLMRATTYGIECSSSSDISAD